jgi:hypothetical protein
MPPFAFTQLAQALAVVAAGWLADEMGPDSVATTPMPIVDPVAVEAAAALDDPLLLLLLHPATTAATAATATSAPLHRVLRTVYSTPRIDAVSIEVTRRCYCSNFYSGCLQYHITVS